MGELYLCEITTEELAKAPQTVHAEHNCKTTECNAHRQHSNPIAMLTLKYLQNQQVTLKHLDEACVETYRACEAIPWQTGRHK